jgi:transposase
MASTLFGVQGVVVVEVDVEADGGLTVWLATDPRLPPACPDCAVVSDRVHEYVLTRPRDLPRPAGGAAVGVAPVAVVWAKRRWRCGNPDCPRATFTESVPQIPPGARLIERVREHVAQLIGEAGMPVCTAAAQVGVSWPSAHQALIDRVDPVPDTRPGPVEALGIDETRRGRPRFTRDPDTSRSVVLADRWHTGFVDLAGGQGLLGQVEGRTADDAAYWLHQAGPAWRAQVRVVVIDMSTIYASAVRRMLPHARLAVDPFHVVQLATKMVGDVRRRVVREKYGRRGRSGDAEYGVKNLLLRNREHLTPDQFDKILSTLDGDAAGQQILLAWIAKEKLRDLIRLRERICGTHPTPERIRHHLHEFFTWCATYDHIPELTSLAQTIDRWRDPITTAIELGVSNAKSEGLNRVIKLEGRKAYGFRNTTNQRRRLRYATTRTSRPPTTTKPRPRTVITRQHDPGQPRRAA